MKKYAILVLALAAAFTVDAQCRSFVKNNCGEDMGAYVPSENFNAAKLLAGDGAEIDLTFYADEDYRLLVCAHDILGDVEFQLIDGDSQVLHDNSEHGYDPKFDFRVAGTQELTLRIQVPPSDSKINPQGCVAILVGRKVEIN